MSATTTLRRLFADWMEAEQRARNAEVALYRAYVDAVTPGGLLPSREQRLLASSMRAEARAKYAATMTAVDKVLADADERSCRW